MILKKKIVLKSYDYFMFDIFNRVKKGKYWNTKLELYTKKTILETIKYFEDKEEFEKCSILKDFMDERFSPKYNKSFSEDGNKTP